MAKHKNMEEQYRSTSREEIEEAVLADPTVFACLSKLIKRSKKQESLKQQKDRKTSFFRTILKHLKGRRGSNSSGAP